MNGIDLPFPTNVRDEAAMSAWCRVAMRAAGFDTLAKKILVRWNERMRTTAGRAFFPAGLIELNPKLLAISREEVERTLRHELAHLLANARAGRRRIESHGAEWRAACVDLGISGERACHRLPFERRVMARRYEYFCPQCGVSFSRVRVIKKISACMACCKKFNLGKYDARFRLRLRGRE